MDTVDNILQQIAYCITSKEYIWTNIEKIAIADNCHSPHDWNELLVTANAMLNTNGGTIITGIVDDEYSYQFIFKGFDSATESQLAFITDAFSNDSGLALNLKNNFVFEKKPFMDGQVMVIVVSPLAEERKYVYYQNTAWQRLVTGNHRIPGHSMNTQNDTGLSKVDTETTVEGTAQPESVAELQPENAENAVPVFQKIYSGELITLFGADYISLEPDYKQLLSFIYERNNTDSDYPTPAEITSKLWVIRGEINAPNAFALFELKIKKILALLEKNTLILKQNSKPGYRINTSYEVVKNLFN